MLINITAFVVILGHDFMKQCLWFVAKCKLAGFAFPTGSFVGHKQTSNFCL